MLSDIIELFFIKTGLGSIVAKFHPVNQINVGVNDSVWACVDACVMTAKTIAFIQFFSICDIAGKSGLA